MLLIFVALLVVMALAVITAFVAYPDRRELMPHAVKITDQADRIRDRLEP